MTHRDSAHMTSPDDRADDGAGDRATVVPLHPRATTSGMPEAAQHHAAPPDKLWREALGEEIHRQRVHRKERLKDTAERAGISPQYLSELERGMKDPSSEILEAVAGALGKSSFDLVRSTVAGGVTVRLGGRATNDIGVSALTGPGPMTNCLVSPTQFTPSQSPGLQLATA